MGSEESSIQAGRRDAGMGHAGERNQGQSDRPRLTLRHPLPSSALLPRTLVGPTPFLSWDSGSMVFLALFFSFLGLHLWPSLGVESELQLPAAATATAKRDPSHFCNLHHSSQQCQILNPLSKARDQTCILRDTIWVLNPPSHIGNSQPFLLLFVFSKCIFT